MKIRNGFLCISVVLCCVFCSVSVPVFNSLSGAALVRCAEKTSVLRKGAVQTEDIFAALEIHPIKAVPNTEKRFSADFLCLGAESFEKITASFCFFHFFRQKIVPSKNKYLKSIFFLQTLF